MERYKNNDSIDIGIIIHEIIDLKINNDSNFKHIFEKYPNHTDYILDCLIQYYYENISSNTK